MRSKIKEPVLSFAQLISADIFVKALAVVALAFYTRYLPKPHLSLLPIYEMLAGMSTLFFSFGILPTFVRSLPSLLQSDPPEARGMVLTGACPVLGGAAFFSLSIFCFAVHISRLLCATTAYASLLQLMTIGFFTSAVTKLAQYLLWAASRFGKVSIMNMFNSLANVLLTVGLLLLLGLKGLVLGLVIRDAISACLSLFFLRDILFTGPVRYYSLKKLLKQSVPFYLEGYLIYFRAQGDYWIVSTMLGPAAMATYYVAKRIYAAVLTLFESADKVITTDLARRREDLKDTKERISQLLIVISQTAVPLVFLIIGLAPSIIYVVAGKQYADSVVPCIILCVAILAQFVRAPIGRAIFVLKPPVARFKLTAVDSTCLVTALLLLTPLLNEPGVALSRFLSSAVAAVYACLVLKSVLAVRIPIGQIAMSLAASLPMTAFLLSCQMLNFNLFALPLYVCGSLLLFIYLTSKLNSKVFYETLNLILPFNVVDPLKLRLRCRSGVGESE